jgi:hypothetical protein
MSLSSFSSSRGKNSRIEMPKKRPYPGPDVLE